LTTPPNPRNHSREAPDADPTVCARCAERWPTCCRLDPGVEEMCFPLSEMEWERILEQMGEQGSFAQEPNSLPFVENLKRLFPGEKERIDALFPPYATHLRLATRPDGSCVFLGRQGCVLRQEARPYYCRLFPLWVHGSRLTMFEPARCLAVREGRTLRGVLEALGLTDKEARALFGRLRLAWGLPPHEGLPLLQQAFGRYRKR